MNKRTCVRLPLSKALLDAHTSYATVVIANEPFLEFWVDEWLDEADALIELSGCIADKIVKIVPDEAERAARAMQRIDRREREAWTSGFASRLENERSEWRAELRGNEKNE